MPAQDELPSNQTVQAILVEIMPGYLDFQVQALAGSYSNQTHLVIVKLAGGIERKIVVRRYNADNGDCEGKARREFATLKLLLGQPVPVPKPIYLDAAGELLAPAGIVTEFVPGNMIVVAKDPADWVARIEQVAQLLAQIHQTPYDAETQAVMKDANKEATWFLKQGSAPEFMKRHPDGEMIWETLNELMPKRQIGPPGLIHLDYWSGNILWEAGRISAVVDWEEASYGEPGVDVAYCLMELYLFGLDAAADRFLQAYEHTAGSKVTNLGLWELAAAARPMTDLEGWMTQPGMVERFRAFIARAKVMALANV